MRKVNLDHFSVADTGFPIGGGANPRMGAPTYYLINFSRKVHENKEILAESGASLAPPPLYPSLFLYWHLFMLGKVGLGT